MQGVALSRTGFGQKSTAILERYPLRGWRRTRAGAWTPPLLTYTTCALADLVEHAGASCVTSTMGAQRRLADAWQHGKLDALAEIPGGTSTTRPS